MSKRFFAAPLPIGMRPRFAETREEDPPSDEDSDCPHTNSNGSPWRSRFCPQCGAQLKRTDDDAGESGGKKVK